MSRKPNAAAPALTLSFASPVERIVHVVLNTPGIARDDGKSAAGLPVVWKAPPGVGKTARLRTAARRGGFHLETVIASLREPSDFVGLPVPAPGGTMQYVPAAWAVNASDAGHSVVFFDELNAAPQAVQMALLRVILDGVCGDLPLPNEVRFMAAMNGTDDCPGRWDLDPAMANRFLHLDWPTLDARGWSSWLLGGAGGAEDESEPLDPGDEFNRVLGLWPSAWARVRGMVAAFIERRPDLLHKMPAAGDPAVSGAWCSPRSWELGARALGGAAVHGLPEQDADALLAGAVGASAALEFSAWRANADLPDPVAILDGKVKFEHAPTRPDRTMATLAGCAAVLLDNTCAERTKRADRLFAVMLDCVAANAADMAVLAQMALIESKAHRGAFMAAPTFTKVMAKMEPFTRAAGMGGAK